MPDTVTRNCPWGYSCKKEWTELLPTKSRQIRFCDDCQSEVLWVDDKDEVFESIILNRCICFDPDLMQDELAELGHTAPPGRLLGFPIFPKTEEQPKFGVDPDHDDFEF